MFIRSKVEYTQGAFWIRITVLLLRKINSELKIFDRLRISAIICVAVTNICPQVYIQNLNPLEYWYDTSTELKIINDSIFATQDRIYLLGNRYHV